jgi:flagellar biosynthesis/type III secretory pathway protein FliH
VKEKKPLSRIVSGDSPEVKIVQAAQATPRQLKEFPRAQFRAIRSVDSVTNEEADLRSREAAQKARQITSQEVEQKMRQPLQQALTNLESVLDEVSRFRRELFKEAEQEVLELVRRVCVKVLGHELSVKPEALVEIIERAVTTVERERFVKLVLNPQDLQMFLRAKPEMDKHFAGRAEIEIRTDTQVVPGSAVLQTESRQIDVSLEAMIDEVLSKVHQQIEEVKETGDEGDKV